MFLVALGSCDVNVSLQIHIGLGGMPLEVLFPNEFSSIFVGEAGPSESDKRIDELFNRSFFLVFFTVFLFFIKMRVHLKGANLSGKRSVLVF